MKKSVLIVTAFALALPLGAQSFVGPRNLPGSNGESYSFSFTWNDVKNALEGKQKGPEEISIPAPTRENDVELSESKQELDASAIEEMTRLAQSGNAEFQYNLGRCYDRGLKVKQDYKQALYWYEKAAAQGHDKAANNLGCLYLDGKGTAQDFDKALYWFELSAQKNDSYAVVNIGCMYEDGQLGDAPNYGKAFEYYQKADKMGCAPAAYELGHCFQDGVGTKANAKKAFSYYKKSADAGFALAAYETGRLYLEGNGVKKDAALAKKYLEFAAKKGEAKAAELLETLQ